MIILFIVGITLIILCIILVLYFVCRNRYENFNDCSNTLHPCEDGKCVDCPDNFECVTVDSDDNYIFNDTKVPPGDYCLPKKNGTECNRYTGRWVWTSSEDGSQTWKCECLYPQLFGNDGDITDCTLKKACQNPLVDGSGNKLVGNSGKSIPENLRGKVWDPVEGDADVLMVNPYTTDNEGNPYFSCVCKCDSNSGKCTTTLPLSPYTCHIDQCWLNQQISGVSVDPNGKVTCNCRLGGGKTIPDGNLAGTCFNPPTYCGEGGGWDPDKKMCICANGKVPVRCGNDKYGLVGQKDINGNEIKCPGNPLGRMCYDPCTALTPCLHGGSCRPKGIDYSCVCPPPGKDGKKWQGKNCGPDFCYISGVKNGITRFNIAGNPYCSGGDQSSCCSNRRTTGRNEGDPCTCD